MCGFPNRRGITAALGGDCTSPPIGEALAFRSGKNSGGAFAIAHFAGVIAKIELFAVATKVRFAHVVIGSDHAPLENLKEGFGGVGVHEATVTEVLFSRMIHRLMTVHFTAHSGKNWRFVSH